MKLYQKIVKGIAYLIPDSLVENSQKFQSLKNELEELKSESQKNLEQITQQFNSKIEEIRLLKSELKNLPEKIKNELVPQYETRIASLENEITKIKEDKDKYFNEIYTAKEEARKTRLELAMEKAERERIIKQEIINRYGKEISYLKRQSLLQIGNIAHKDVQIKKLKSEAISNSLTALEEVSQDFAKTPGLFLDHLFNPLYATKSFYEIYQIPEKNLLTNHQHGILSYLDTDSRRKIRDYIHNKTRIPPKINFKIENSEYTIRFMPIIFLDENNQVIGTYVILKDINQDILERYKQKKHVNILSTLIQNLSNKLKQLFSEQSKQNA